MCIQLSLVSSLLIICASTVDGQRTRVNGHVSFSREEQDANYWRARSATELREALDLETNTKEAKNVIFFLGDGMGPSVVFSSRVFKGQQRGNPGEEESLSFEKFPFVGFSKTYSVDHQIADSAAASTAYHHGTKSRHGTIGVGPNVERGNCPQSRDNDLASIAEKALEAGKSAGFVTTTRITHATVAGLYAYAADRNWESDSLLSDSAKRGGCPDIAAQLLTAPGNRMNVIMGGGRAYVMGRNLSDPEYPVQVGNREDGRDIPRLWLNQHREQGNRAMYAWHRDNITSGNLDNVDYLLGTFEPAHMKYAADRRGDDPSLEDMVQAAIRVLQKNPNGYYLFVEGGLIDVALHESWARRAFEETIAFDEAIQTAVDMTNPDDTLFIISADHSQSITSSSMPTRGNPILGLTDWSQDETEEGFSDRDERPYTTLAFANGPGFQVDLVNGVLTRRAIRQSDIDSREYRYASAVPLTQSGHEGSDVPIYAKGPWAHLFHSTHEDIFIYDVIQYASCIGDYRGQCGTRNTRPPIIQNHSNGSQFNTLLTIIMLFIAVLLNGHFV